MTKQPDFTLGLHQHFHSSMQACYVEAEAVRFANPQLVFFNQDLADSFVATFPISDEELALLFSAQHLPADAKPIAQAYAGHQFGHFNPQLGDGRAMIIGELQNKQGKLTELDLKGSGPTPFSRGGDGKAALAPMLREVLIAEAMNALGIPTTRSLAVVSTGEQVYRDPPQPGAVLARTASSHIRIGTFQFFAAREQYDVVKSLVDFSITRHYPQLASSENKALDLLKESIKAQAELIAKWMGLGFIHGVMNTDNMLISAETIDYGPCAFMDIYDPQTVFSSIDRNSRYAYSNQPGVAQWNLSRFAETLLPLIDNDKEKSVELATQAVRGFMDEYIFAFRKIMSNKLGISLENDTESIDTLIQEWTELLHANKMDWTLSHYYLGQYLQQGKRQLFELFTDEAGLQEWLAKRAELSSKQFEQMIASNPIVIPRNHLVEEALQKASEENDFTYFESLLQHLLKPYEWPEDKKYTEAAPIAFTVDFMTFCGT